MGNVSEKDEFYEKEKRIKENQALEMMKKAFVIHDPNDLIRFLIANGYDCKKANQMFQNNLEWKRDYKPGNISIEIFEKELNQNRCYFLGHTKSQIPLFYFLARNHFPSSQWEHSVHFGCVIHDAFLLLSSTPGLLQFNGIVDLSGVSMENIDMKLIKRGIEIYQDYYPERLDVCYVLGLPSAFIGLWSIIENLLDERTRKRVIILKENQKISDYYLAENLPKELGGTKELNHEEFLNTVKSYYASKLDS